jgi:hypothetical protein
MCASASRSAGCFWLPSRAAPKSELAIRVKRCSVNEANRHQSHARIDLAAHGTLELLGPATGGLTNMVAVENGIPG